MFGVWCLVFRRMSTIALVSFAALSCNALWKWYTGFCKTIFVDIFYRYIYSLLRKLLERIYLSRFDGSVKSQIGSLRCLLSGFSTPAAKFQELVASSSNSLSASGGLTPPVSKPFFRKRQCRSPIRLFTRLS